MEKIFRRIIVLSWFFAGEKFISSSCFKPESWGGLSGVCADIIYISIRIYIYKIKKNGKGLKLLHMSHICGMQRFSAT